MNSHAQDDNQTDDLIQSQNSIQHEAVDNTSNINVKVQSNSSLIHRLNDHRGSAETNMTTNAANSNVNNQTINDGKLQNNSSVANSFGTFDQSMQNLQQKKSLKGQKILNVIPSPLLPNQSKGKRALSQLSHLLATQNSRVSNISQISKQPSHQRLNEF